MGKIYDAKGISTFSKEREKAYKNLEDQLQTLHKALAAVSKLDDSLQGKGADNIKKFYEYQVDNAKCWIDLVQMTKSYFSALYVKAEDANLAGNTVVDLSFLEHDLKQSVSQAKELVAQQREDLQTILHKVDDLVSLSAFSAEDFNDSIDKAEKKRDETVEAVEKLDAEWLEGYRQMESNYLLTQAATNSLHGATTQGGQAYPVLFDQKAYHASELYKVQKEASEYATNYVTYHEEMKNVHELKKEAERQAVEEANKKWYEKTWDTVSTFTGEVTGYYDYKRAAEGVDPVTGRELSTSERVAAGAMAAAGFIPVVGWAGRAAKGGKAIYVTAKGVNAADHALDAYKTSKSFKALEQAEKGLYGLVAANGMYEFTTGKDMFGNAISEEQRQNSLFQSLGIAGAGALSTRYAANMGQAVVTKGTEKLTQMRNTLRTSAVANVTKQAYQSVKTAPASWTQSLHKTYTSILDSTMPRLMPELAPAGPALAQQTVRETLQNVKQQAMQMITPIYNPKVKRYQDPETGRFVANPNVERVEKPVGVEKKGKEVELVRNVESVQDVSKGTGEGPVKVNYGEQYAREKRKKILKPNVEYTSKEGYTYTTDSQGRVASCEGSLQLGDGKRNNYAQRVVGGNDRLDDDDGGHLIATIFKGSGNMDNLVPMNSNLNRGEWKKLENEWANALNDGDKVRVKITPNYSGNSKRPDSFVIRYKIGDEDRWRLKNFDNVPGGKLDE
ncbi:DNA/RNA non-specific endonuclease [Priestia flexa]|uniref:DNA/RNA non-specific endonuclease n=1 Tax=Priestia flexa TaxID=86664 RepID=UPI0024C0761A|nr:DNA/RNA non-specific endonuclease [Priestia flexa]WHX77376.1 DNA/RNA non-specific endonuclease [Priestia flexa]